MELTLPSGSVADAYLALLSDRGVDCIFANAGTDFAPIIEALAKAQEMGSKVPRPITVPHENVAISMAAGYYLKTGRPQVVMVHVDVGTANALCGLMNASRGNIPILFSAGRTPFSEEGDLLGGRSGEIHWPQEMRDQGSLVREFVKWDYQLNTGAVLEATIDRALNLATSEPTGPIYLILPREVLAAPLDNFRYQSPSRRTAATAPFPDTHAIDRAADMLASAENPLIITSGLGRIESDAPKLAALAERFAIPVTQRKPRYMCLPTDHPMHLGYEPDEYIREADLIVVIECDVPWIPRKKAPTKDCKVIHLGVDPLYANYPLRGFTCDLAITGIPGATLPLLDAALESRKGKAKARIDARRKRLEGVRQERHEKLQATLERVKDADPIHPIWISHCLNQVKGERSIVLKESPLAFDCMSYSRPGTFYSIGSAGGLGWSLGTSLGLKMAAPEELVICTVGDGAYMFGNPVPAHYVARAEGLPVLTVVFNNEMWGAVKRNTREVYPKGYASRSNHEPLTYFQSGSHFEKAVEVADGYGERVVSAADVPRAIDRALKAVLNDKRQALLNVICRGP